MKQTVYIETTIVSYLTARPSTDVISHARALITQQWWRQARPLFDPVTSDFVVQEAGMGDTDAARRRLEVLATIPSLSVVEPTVQLAHSLVAALNLPPRARLDGAHVAIAAAHDVPFLLTWNCRHLANGMLAPIIEDVCLTHGCSPPRLLTPEMLMEVP